jgi:hypothetical protein
MLSLSGEAIWWLITSWKRPFSWNIRVEIFLWVSDLERLLKGTRVAYEAMLGVTIFIQ